MLKKLISAIVQNFAKKIEEKAAKKGQLRNSFCLKNNRLKVKKSRINISEFVLISYQSILKTADFVFKI